KWSHHHPRQCSPQTAGCCARSRGHAPDARSIHTGRRAAVAALEPGNVTAHVRRRYARLDSESQAISRFYPQGGACCHISGKRQQLAIQSQVIVWRKYALTTTTSPPRGRPKKGAEKGTPKKGTGPVVLNGPTSRSTEVNCPHSFGDAELAAPAGC